MYFLSKNSRLKPKQNENEREIRLVLFKMPHISIVAKITVNHISATEKKSTTAKLQYK